MLNIITIATRNFLPHAERLLVSLQSSGNVFHLTVYCDDRAVFSRLANLGPSTVVELPEIRALGVKRAKFEAFRRAIEAGGFLYLDADIIVLERLDELAGLEALAGCPDDLSECLFIPDKRHPWPGAPELENRIYINSGVLFVPSSTRDFFQYLHQQSLSDEHWTKFIIPGGLYDNHFLCAYLNLTRQPLHLLDETVYNWQGFYKRGELQVVRHSDALVNRHSGAKLRLVHFAGIREIDRFLGSLPVAISSFLCARSTAFQAGPDQALTGYLATLSPHFSQALPDPFVETVFQHLAGELSEIARTGFRRDYRAEPSYFSQPDALASLVYSKPNTNVLWNGLLCGGAYLDGEEYNFLSRLIESCRIRSVLETGAGETSILFRRRGLEALAIEANPGPWLDRAKREGCRCFLVPFDRQALLFDQRELERALEPFKSKPLDLLFIDSPTGTGSRSRILRQLLGIVQPRFILFHDAHRDAMNMFRDSLELGLQLAGYLPSRRGLVLFLPPEGPGEPRPLLAPLPEDASFESPDAQIAVLDVPREVFAGQQFAIRIHLENRSACALSSRYRHPVFLSYHWFDQEGRCLVFDGHRTSLPFDIDPGNSATFDVQVAAPNAAGEARLQVSLVQEGVCWFHDRSEKLAAWQALRIVGQAQEESMPGKPQEEGSPEASIRIAYRQTLKRDPDDQGLRHFKAFLESGGSPSQFVLDLIQSEEFLRNYGPTLGIVTEDMTREVSFWEICQKCRDFSITSMAMMYALYKAVEYVVKQRIPGDILECGVWKGGSCMLAAHTLLLLQETERSIYLYDTFAGMTEPTGHDIRFDGASARSLWAERKDQQNRSLWSNCSLAEVRDNLLATGYPAERLHFVEGPVERTIPDTAPERIAVLRLDTDWYQSTLHELRHLYPRLSPGGVLIIDDYGWWSGSRKATDQYWEENRIPMLLCRVDSSGSRMGVKMP